MTALARGELGAAWNWMDDPDQAQERHDGQKLSEELHPTNVIDGKIERTIPNGGDAGGPPEDEHSGVEHSGSIDGNDTKSRKKKSKKKVL